MTGQTPQLSGIIFGCIAFCLFAIMPVYVQQLDPISGYIVLAQRILWSCILVISILALTGKLKENLKSMRNPKAWPGLLAGSFLISLQWGVFVWAPLNGQTLDLSLGYFLMPLVMVFVGRVFLNERLRPMQWLALMFSAMGVLMAYLNSDGLSWVVVIIIIGYPLYLMLRRYQSLPSFSAFLIENIILLPFALVAILLFGDIDGGSLPHPFAYSLDWIFLFIGVAALGSVPMLCFIAANKRLPISILGLLSYLEPTLIFIMAYFVLNEEVLHQEWLIYMAVAMGLLVSLIDGIWHITLKYRQ